MLKATLSQYVRISEIIVDVLEDNNVFHNTKEISSTILERLEKNENLKFTKFERLTLNEIWNDEVTYIQKMLEWNKSDTYAFKWTHLVYQELVYWLEVEKIREIKFNEITLIADRRGFDIDMVNFIKSTLIKMGVVII